MALRQFVVSARVWCWSISGKERFLTRVCFSATEPSFCEQVVVVIGVTQLKFKCSRQCLSRFKFLIKFLWVIRIGGLGNCGGISDFLVRFSVTSVGVHWT